MLFLKIIIFSISPIFSLSLILRNYFFFYEFSNPLGWAWAGKPPPPFGLLSDMALETSPKICHFFNHLLIVPLATSNLSAIACKVIPVALNSLACSLLSQLATPFFNPPNRPLFGLYLAKLLISPTGCVILPSPITNRFSNGFYFTISQWCWVC